FADYDNDGWKDLLITNGYLRDYTNLDFLRNMDNYVKQNKQMKRADVLNLVNQMPETELYNYIYKNNGNATFTHINQDWGMTEGSYSNGAVYVDLDNDGDLDIVTNNINKPAFIYENKSNEINENNFLKVKLNGRRKNKFGHGAKVYLYHGDQLQMLEQQPARGYQSSVSTILHFGIGKINLIDSLKVEWQGGISQTKKNIPANKTIVLKEVDATPNIVKPPASQPIFKEVPSSIKFTHAENDLNDFKRQPLMLNAKSFEGPCMAKADINRDGLEDVFIGGGGGQTGSLFFQTESGFRKQHTTTFDNYKASDDVDAVFFDANNDGFPDLYVCSGGYHNFLQDDANLQDRLYINDGSGGFRKSERGLPAMLISSGCVTVNDVNEDGFHDLFVGGFVIPGRYPEIPTSALLIND
ncbi:MAG: VCBS repeat-containing protein, partial [Cyclobacteriaceae bacterium]|nr:VCBS repeat-containing protein [Cyclobacteriaceae bacterium]